MGGSASSFPISARFWSARPTSASTTPKRVRCEVDERDYILQSLAFVLPDIAIRPEQIVFQFSGVRPLPASDRQLYRPHSARPFLHGRRSRRWQPAGAVHDRRQVDDVPLLRRTWPPTWRWNGSGSSVTLTTADRPIGGGRAFPADATAWLGQAAASHRHIRRTHGGAVFPLRHGCPGRCGIYHRSP